MPAKLIVRDLTHHYPDEYTGEDIHALDRLSLEVYEGELAAVVGPSGCGKTTLLNILGDRCFIFTRRPGRLKATVTIDVPRARRIWKDLVSDPAFTGPRDEILQLVRAEVRSGE